MVADSGLVPVVVEGWAKPAWADPEALAKEVRGRHRTTLLSPFDSLIWERARTERIFGFTHRLEAYVPKQKRIHGYFAMPLLAGGKLQGRVDPAREGTTLVAKQASPAGPKAVAPMAEALVEAAAWVGCTDIRVDRVDPAGAARAAQDGDRPRAAARLSLNGAAAPAGRLPDLEDLLAHGIDDGFHPGVQLQFLQDIADVVLHRVLGNEQLLAISRLFMPVATSFSTSSSRSVSRGAGTSRRSSVRWIIDLNSVSSLEAMEGLIWDWPSATARMAVATSSVEISLRRYPVAPALIAS